MCVCVLEMRVEGWGGHVYERLQQTEKNKGRCYFTEVQGKVECERTGFCFAYNNSARTWTLWLHKWSDFPEKPRHSCLFSKQPTANHCQDLFSFVFFPLHLSLTRSPILSPFFVVFWRGETRSRLLLPVETVSVHLQLLTSLFINKSLQPWTYELLP